MAEMPTAFGGFVGRSRELRVAARALDAARRGSGGLLLVTGEAGIGKTRFCREVTARAHRSGLAVAWGAAGRTGRRRRCGRGG
jgi:transcriptional regulator with AAA-type ATPase domain